MFQRSHAEAGYVGHDQFAAVIIVRVEPLGKILVLVADTLVRHLRGVAAAELGKAVVCQVDSAAQIVGDHGRFCKMPGIVLREGHHGRGFSGTEESAEYGEFLHIILPLII